MKSANGINDGAGWLAPFLQKSCGRKQRAEPFFAGTRPYRCSLILAAGSHGQNRFVPPPPNRRARPPGCRLFLSVLVFMFQEANQMVIELDRIVRSGER